MVSMRVAVESELDLQFALEATKRRVRTVGLATGVGVWFAAAAAWLLVFVIADHATPAGVGNGLRRIVAGLFWLGSFAWFWMACAAPFVRQINDLYVARLIEKTHPEFRNTLVDAIQITRHEELPGSVRSAVMERAARDVTCIEPARSVPLVRLRRAARAATVVLAIFVLYGLLAPKAVWPSLGRGLGLALRAPTYTRIVSLSPEDDASVLAGRPVTFAVRLAGRQPGTAFLRFSFDGGATWSDGQQLPLTPPLPEDPSGPWRAIKAGEDVRQTMLWQVVAGDDASEHRRLEVRPVPAITDVSVRYVFPPATHLPPATRPGGDIDALRGTQVTIRAATNVPAFNSLLILGRPPDERNRVLDVMPQGTRDLRIALAVTSDDEYRIEFRDAHGEVNPNPVRYTIRARVPAAPVASAPPPLAEQPEEKAASQRTPAETRPAKKETIRQVKIKRASPDSTGDEAALTQPSRGETVVSTTPAGNGQPKTRLATTQPSKGGTDVSTARAGNGQPTTQLATTQPEKGEGGMDQQEAVRATPASGPAPNEKKFAEQHRRELEKLTQRMVEQAESQPSNGSAPQPAKKGWHLQDRVVRTKGHSNMDMNMEAKCRGIGDVGASGIGEGQPDPSSKDGDGSSQGQPSASESLSPGQGLPGQVASGKGSPGQGNGSAQGQTNGPTQGQGSANESSSQGQDSPGQETSSPGQGSSGQVKSQNQGSPGQDITQIQGSSGQNKPQNQSSSGQEKSQNRGSSERDIPGVHGSFEQGIPQTQSSSGQEESQNRGSSEREIPRVHGLPGQGIPQTQTSFGQAESQNRGSSGQDESQVQDSSGQYATRGLISSPVNITQAQRSSGQGKSQNQGSSGQPVTVVQGSSGPDTNLGHGNSAGPENVQIQGSPGQDKSQNQDSSGQAKSQNQGSSGQEKSQRTGSERQEASQGRGNPSRGGGKPSEKANQQPSGTGSSAGGGAGEGSAPASAPGGGTDAESQPSESLDQGAGSPSRGPTIEQARQAIDALDRDLRRGQVDPGLLDELGWDVQTAERFVQAFKQSEMLRQNVAESTTQPAERPVQASPESHRKTDAIRAVGGPASGVRGLNEAGTRPADDTHDLMQVGHQRVPARYQPFLEAYYRSLASQPSP